MNKIDERSKHLNPLHRMTVVDEIVEQLIGLVVDEGLKPGDKLLPERELMARLMVGRSSLREAIKTLCALGILEIKRGLGTYVGYGDTSILSKSLAWGLFLSRNNVQQVIEARSVIEVTLAGWAAERATEEEIASIGQLLDQMEASWPDRGSYVDLDMKFHLAIAEVAHNTILFYVLSSFQRMMRVWMETTYKETGGAKDSMALHREIYEAIRTHNMRTAREFMAAHTSGIPLLAATARISGEDQAPRELLSLLGFG